MSRFAIVTTIWAALLVVGFAAVFTLGAPLPNEEQELEAALHPSAPVSQEVAEQSAATIVRLRHGDLVDASRSVFRRSDFGVDRWVITYTADGPTISGVTVSIVIDTGRVEVASFP